MPTTSANVKEKADRPKLVTHLMGDPGLQLKSPKAAAAVQQQQPQEQRASTPNASARDVDVQPPPPKVDLSSFVKVITEGTDAEVEQAINTLMQSESSPEDEVTPSGGEDQRPVHRFRDSGWQTEAVEQGFIGGLLSVVSAAASIKSPESAMEAKESVDTSAADVGNDDGAAAAAKQSGETESEGTASARGDGTLLAVLRCLGGMGEVYGGACRSELAKPESVQSLATLCMALARATTENTVEERSKVSEQLLGTSMAMLSSLVFTSSDAIGVLEADRCATGRALASTVSTSLIETHLTSYTLGSDVENNSKESTGEEGRDAMSASSPQLCEGALRLLITLCRSTVLRLSLLLAEDSNLVRVLVSIALKVPRLSQLASRLLQRLVSGSPLAKQALTETMDRRELTAPVVDELLEGVTSQDAGTQECALRILIELTRAGLMSSSSEIIGCLEKDALAVRVVLGLLEERGGRSNADDDDEHGNNLGAVDGGGQATGNTTSNEEGGNEDGADGADGARGDAQNEAGASVDEDSDRDELAIARSTVMATAFGLNEDEEKHDEETDLDGSEHNENGLKERPVEPAKLPVLQALALEMMLLLMDCSADEGKTYPMLSDFIAEARPDLPTLLDNVAFVNPLTIPAAVEAAEQAAPDANAAPPSSSVAGTPRPSPGKLLSPRRAAAAAVEEPPTAPSADPRVTRGVVSVLRHLMKREGIDAGMMMVVRSRSHSPLSAARRSVPSTSSSPGHEEHEDAAAAPPRVWESITDFILSEDFIMNVCNALTASSNEDLQCAILDFVSELSMELPLESKGLLRTNGVLAALTSFAKKTRNPTGLLKRKLATALLCFPAEDFIPPIRPKELDMKSPPRIPKTAYDWDALGREIDVMLM